MLTHRAILGRVAGLRLAVGAYGVAGLMADAERARVLPDGVHQRRLPGITRLRLCCRDRRAIG